MPANCKNLQLLQLLSLGTHIPIFGHFLHQLDRHSEFLREQQLGFKIAIWIDKKIPGTKGPHSP
jgi:hypothetical protein